jgi:NADPH:quinone reductase-like Zn-dependent oxidoreductase
MPSGDLPSLMQAVLLTGHGGFDVLEYRDDVPVPSPAAGEVLIRVGAAAVNNTDINTRTGWYSKAAGSPTGWTGEPLAFPRIQGADACGRIVAVGVGVDGTRVGERVLVEPAFDFTRMPGGRLAYFGSECDGAFAQFARVPAMFAHRIDSVLSDVELASFPVSYSAAENMLSRAGVTRGETVVVMGASGGVGSAAVQLAKARGALVVAVTGESKRVQLTALGADRVVGRDDSLIERLGRGYADVVVDVAGGRQFPQLLGLLRRGGRYAVAGAIAGAVVELDLRTLYLEDLRLLGCTALDPGVFARLIGYIERGDIRPLVAKTYALRDIVAAQEEFLAKRHVGKIVLVPPVA